jgi:hypothetical protein
MTGASAANELHHHHEPVVIFQQLVDRAILDDSTAQARRPPHEAGGGVRDGCVKNLEGDLPPERLVDSPIDAAHATVSEALDDEVLTESSV